MDKSVKDMAREMCDSKLLVKLSGGVDLVAIEGKYHLTCLTKFRNCYRAFQRAQKDSLTYFLCCFNIYLCYFNFNIFFNGILTYF